MNGRPQIPKPSETSLKELQVNGVGLSYLDRGTGTPVVFVHGALDDYRMWDAQIKRFSTHHRVIAYSRRYNYPNDNRLRGSKHSALIEADDLASLIKKLKLPPAHIVGHSYGGYTALLLAIKHPELVRTLTLSEPPVFSIITPDREGKSLVKGFLDELWKPSAEAFKDNDEVKALRLTVKYFAGDDVLDQVPQEAREYWLSNMREWRSLTTSSNPFPKVKRKEIRRISVPVLMLTGEKTVPLLALVVRRLHPIFRHSQLMTFKNVSHDMWTEQPDDAGNTVLAFLSNR